MSHTDHRGAEVTRLVGVVIQDGEIDGLGLPPLRALAELIGGQRAAGK
jgi:hypothetical protein